MWVYGDLNIIYPRPNSIYLSGTIAIFGNSAGDYQANDELVSSTLNLQVFRCGGKSQNPAPAKP